MTFKTMKEAEDHRTEVQTKVSAFMLERGYTRDKAPEVSVDFWYTGRSRQGGRNTWFRSGPQFPSGVRVTIHSKWLSGNRSTPMAQFREIKAPLDFDKIFAKIDEAAKMIAATKASEAKAKDTRDAVLERLKGIIAQYPDAAQCTAMGIWNYKCPLSIEVSSAGALSIKGSVSEDLLVKILATVQGAMSGAETT